MTCYWYILSTLNIYCICVTSLEYVLVDAAQEQVTILQGELASVQELGFAFKRAASRLIEMSGVEYNAAWKCRMSP